MRPTRFVFVEGIMGAGKTTTAWHLAGYLNRRHIAARFLPEGRTPQLRDHPLRLATTLPHPRAVWEDVTVEEYVDRSLQLWQAYVGEASRAETVTVCDGLLFHGNMTDLLLMDATPATLQRYVAQVLEILSPLTPTVVYLRREDVAAALRAVCDVRGAQWELYQVNWKLASPYALRRSLRGFDGLAHLYREYRAICDTICAQLPVPKLVTQVDDDWDAYFHEILSFLELPQAI